MRYRIFIVTILVVPLLACSIQQEVRNYNADPFELLNGNVRKKGEPFVGIGYISKRNAIPSLTVGNRDLTTPMGGSSSMGASSGEEDIVAKINKSIQMTFTSSDIIDSAPQIKSLRTPEVVKKVVIMPQQVGNMVMESVKVYFVVRNPTWVFSSK